MPPAPTLASPTGSDSLRQRNRSDRLVWRNLGNNADLYSHSDRRLLVEHLNRVARHCRRHWILARPVVATVTDIVAPPTGLVTVSVPAFTHGAGVAVVAPR